MQKKDDKLGNKTVYKRKRKGRKRERKRKIEIDSHKQVVFCSVTGRVFETTNKQTLKLIKIQCDKQRYEAKGHDSEACSVKGCYHISNVERFRFSYGREKTIRIR